MKFQIKADASATQFQTDCIIVPIFKTGELPQSAKAIDKQSSGAITALLDSGDFTASKGSIEVLYNLSGIVSTRVMLAGCGEEDDYDQETVQEIMQKVGKRLQGMKVSHVTSWLIAPLNNPADQQRATQQLVTTLAACFYVLNDYKSEKEQEDEPTLLTECVIAGVPEEVITKNVIAGEAIAQGVELAKNMANQPGNICTPSYLAKHALLLAENASNMDVEILEESDMQALGMGAFLSVSKGSRQDGKLILMNYSGGTASNKPTVLVGKGITFDTGGISLKPGAKMDEMKFDMGGAASVLGTMQAITAMQLPMNVIGVIASAENMPSGHATKPGDIVTSMSGKTIEVLNTDAEGRMVLCDALTFIKKYDPDVVIDIATLTGACIVALGHHICGLISNDDNLANDLMDAGNDALDQAWRLPYNKKYIRQLKSEFADLGNIGGPTAGMITAGCFLSEFTQDYTWAHLDVAGTAWSGKTATGRPVPLLTQYLINRLN